MRVPFRAALALAPLVFFGCRPPEEIRTYNVPREAETAKKPPVVEEAGDKYRFLGAIIPADEKYFWFIKFVGPKEVIAPNEADFDVFMKSIEPSGTSDKPPKYAIPDGWKMVPPKPNQSRIVTIRKGDAEMYLSNPVGGTLLENINRWRKEIGLRGLTEAEAKDGATEITIGKGSKAFRVDVSGPTWNGGAMVPPFAGGGR